MNSCLRFERYQGRTGIKVSLIVFAAMTFLSLLTCPGYPGSLEKADELGDDFQRQMPWSREKPQSGETPGQAQPRDYVAPPEREKTETTTRPQGETFPLCFNPYTRGYETCYPEDSEHWRTWYNSPDFRLWWEQGRSCPRGYYFRPGRGCYRY
jgi:hypothetical protein